MLALALCAPQAIVDDSFSQDDPSDEDDNKVDYDMYAGRRLLLFCSDSSAPRHCCVVQSEPSHGSLEIVESEGSLTSSESC